MHSSCPATSGLASFTNMWDSEGTQRSFMETVRSSTQGYGEIQAFLHSQQQQIRHSLKRDEELSGSTCSFFSEMVWLHGSFLGPYEFSIILNYPYEYMFLCVEDCVPELPTDFRWRIWILEAGSETPEADARSTFWYFA